MFVEDKSYDIDFPMVSEIPSVLDNVTITEVVGDSSGVVLGVRLGVSEKDGDREFETLTDHETLTVAERESLYDPVLDCDALVDIEAETSSLLEGEKLND